MTAAARIVPRSALYLAETPPATTFLNEIVGLLPADVFPHLYLGVCPAGIPRAETGSRELPLCHTADLHAAGVAEPPHHPSDGDSRPIAYPQELLSQVDFGQRREEGVEVLEVLGGDAAYRFPHQEAAHEVGLGLRGW